MVCSRVRRIWGKAAMGDDAEGCGATISTSSPKRLFEMWLTAHEECLQSRSKLFRAGR